MKRYYVELPIAGRVIVAVETDETNKEEIIDLAIEKAADEIKVSGCNDVEFDFYHKLVEGNVCHTNCTRASIEGEEEIE